MTMKTANPYEGASMWSPRMLEDIWNEGYAACERDMQRAGGDVEKQEEKSGPIMFKDEYGDEWTLAISCGCARCRDAKPDDLARAGYVPAQVSGEFERVSDRLRSSLSRIATALGLPETAGEEEIVERCKELGGDQEGTLLHAIGAELAQAVATSSGVPGLSVEALRFLETRVHHYLNGAQLQEGTITQQFVELLASDIRPHLLPTLEELKDEVITAYGGPVPGWIAKKLDAIVAAAKREKANGS